MKPTFKLAKGLSQNVVYELLQTRGSSWLKSHVLFADRQVVILNKPPNVVCQLSYSNHRNENTSIPLNPIFGDIKSWLLSAEPFPVHRLDKATTGCLMVSLNNSTAKSLSQQFVDGTIEKTYLALVRGGKESFSAKSGQINAPILYNDGRGDISPAGKYSITDWELLGSSAKAPISLLKLKLVTGNKHQLRIHLAKCLKVPILGDVAHSRTPLNPLITSIAEVPGDRLFLHASELSFFKYRENGKRFRLGIRAPIPPDFQMICRDVGITMPQTLFDRALLVNGTIVEDEQESELTSWNPARASR